MRKIGVVGCGLMGSGIAEVCARAGLDVVVTESSAAAVEAGRTRLEGSTERARVFVEGSLGKHAIDCQDRAGFVVNALLIPFVLSAIRMLESGFATAEDIDSGLVRGAAHPQGPLALADLIGLDTTKAVAESLYEEFKEPLYAPPPLLARMVDAGLLGRKSGRGFYDYS